jgi:hypothetical protein
LLLLGLGLTTAKAQQAATATGGSATVVEEPFYKTGLFTRRIGTNVGVPGFTSKPNEISRCRRTANKFKHAGLPQPDY